VRLTAFLTSVVPQWATLHLDAVAIGEQQITIEVSSRRRTARCPACRRRSHRAHSRFTRTLADRPVGDLPVCVRLHARRFRCLTPSCPRQTFRERLPDLAPPYQRRTPALRERLEAVSFALGGQAGQRLAQRLRLGGRGISRNTLLRLLRRAALPSVQERAPALRVLGVDDFAFRRGMRYGAVLVDLDQQCVLDLLPDREAATFAAWLKEQPTSAGIEVISRDRSGAFADGARRGAPQAVQVADRFHLLHNLGQAFDRLLTREHRVLTEVAGAMGTTATEQAAEEPQSLLTCRERERARVDERRRARYERVVTLTAEGHALCEVARRVGVSRATVRTYLRSGQYRSCAQHRRPRGCDRFAAYLRQRWDEGEHNSVVLLREIQARGYLGSAATVRLFVQPWRTGPRRPGRRRRSDDTAGARKERHRFSPRQTRWILLRPIEELNQDERIYREALCQHSAPIATAQRLVAEFSQIVRTRTPADLEPWLSAATHSRLPELVSFVHGVRRDAAAVAAALTSPHSQGQVEGQVNRLKMLKRQMYGRASFDLLRRRVLYDSA
jgi:transposase